MSAYKLSTVALAIALTLSAASASAATSITTPLVFDASGDAGFSRSFAKGNIGNFTDSYTFSIDAGLVGDLSAGVKSKYSFSFANIVLAGVDLTGFTLTGPVLVNGTATTTSYDLNWFSLEKNDTFSLSVHDLVAGQYALKVSGSAALTSGIFPAKYSGTVSLVTTPVPEPDSYAMLLAGLGLMGVVARRKRNN